MERLTALLRAVAIENGSSEAKLPEKAKNIQRLITGSLLELATEYDPKDAKAYEAISEQTIGQCLQICAQKD
jgi:hypothetical protein